MDLLGLSATNKPSCGRCAFERDRAEQKTREYGCDMRLFAEVWTGSVNLDCQWGSIGGNQMSSLFSPVSPTTNPGSYSVTASGANRRPAAGSLFCFGYAAFGYGFHLRWNLRKCRASALGVGPTR
jgi:hypothetical protein